MNKTTLIIPDLHHRWEQAEKIISSVGADDILFLGDYFDDFNDTPDMVRATAEWLQDSVTKPNRIHLFGNHDQHYAFPYRPFQCSGYEQWKYFIIQDMLDSKVWDKLKWYHFLDEVWLLTHAGLHNLNVPDEVTKERKDRPKFINELSQYLDAEIHKGFNYGASGAGSWVFNAGCARWGSQRVGGITWCDFNQEFFPVRGINQIMGHTPQMQGARWCIWEKDPKKSGGRVAYRPHDLFTPLPQSYHNTDESFNICLDVHGNTHFGIWNGKKLQIGNYRDL